MPDAIFRAGRDLHRDLEAANGRTRCVTIARDIPAELVSRVLELLCFDDRIRATHVCKRWRSIALAHELLWSRIRCTSATALNDQLARTQRVPVDVQITDITQENLDQVLEIVSRHLYHVRLLRLQASSSMPLGLNYFPTVYAALAHPAPLLEALDVQLSHDPVFPDELTHPFVVPEERDADSSARAVPATFLLGHAPELRKLAFAGMRLPPDGFNAMGGMQNISRLHLDINTLSATQLYSIVSLPRLRSLYLEVYRCDVPRTPAPDAFRLDELWILGPYGGWDLTLPCLLLRYLGFPNIRHFTSTEDVRWLEAMTRAPRRQPHTLMVDEWSVEHAGGELWFPKQAWRMIDDSGFVSDLIDIHVRDHFSWPDGARHMLSHLRKLVISYEHLCLAPYDLSFNHLTRLCVRVHPFPVIVETDLKIPCPALRVLELWGGHDMPQDCLDDLVDAVQEIVVHFLALDEARPPELILRDVGAADRWRKFHGLVSGIRQGDPVPESFVEELRSKWHVVVSDD